MESPLPKTWGEAIPYLVWAVLIFTAGFEGVAAFLDGNFKRFGIAFGLMLFLTAIALYWPLLTRAKPASIPIVLVAFGAVLLISGFILLVKQNTGDVSTPEQGAAPTFTDQKNSPPSLLSIFMSDFRYGNGLHAEMTADVESIVNGSKVKQRLYYAVVYNFDANSKFVVFYIPAYSNIFELINFLATNYLGYVKDFEDQKYAIKKNVGDSDQSDTRKINFSGIVYVYSESPITLEQAAAATKLFRDNGAQLQIRSQDYALSVWQGIKNGAPSIPIYTIQNGIPVLAEKK